MVTGVGTAKATASVMALGLDPRFDFSKTYWIVAGIGGGDPADVSLGSAVWADHVIDGDIAFEIDARQIPQDWPTGICLYAKERLTSNRFESRAMARFTAQSATCGWALGLTRDVPLPDSEKLRSFAPGSAAFPMR